MINYDIILINSIRSNFHKNKILITLFLKEIFVVSVAFETDDCSIIIFFNSKIDLMCLSAIDHKVYWGQKKVSIQALVYWKVSVG